MRPTRTLPAFLMTTLSRPAMAWAKIVKTGVLLPYSRIDKNNADPTPKGMPARS